MCKFPEDFKPNSRCLPPQVERIFSFIYFYPNMCHVCHCLESSTIKLTKCRNCFMLSYCGKEHQLEHWNIHKDFCREMTKLLKANGTKTLFSFMKNIQDPLERFNRKHLLMNLMKRNLKRELLSFEAQMLLYPRICFVCFEADPDLLRNCHFCPQVNVCVKHINNSHHPELCSFYKVCYTVDIYSICNRTYEILPTVEEVSFQDSNFMMPKNMTIYLQKYTNKIPEMWMNLSNYNIWPYITSEYYTMSLTLLHVLNQLNFKVESNFTAHVIGVPPSKEDSFLSLEILLHLISPLKVLNVTLMSSNFNEQIEDDKLKVEVCSRCATEKKNFFLKIVNKPYLSYINSEDFVTPDIVIYYDLSIHRNPLWKESLLEIKKISAPVVVTNNTLLRALNYSYRMNDLLGYLTSEEHLEKNPFASKYPVRNGSDDELHLLNNYVTVYTLHNIENNNQLQKKQGGREKRENKDENSTKKKDSRQKFLNPRSEAEHLNNNTPETSNINHSSQNPTKENSDMKNETENKKQEQKANQTSELSIVENEELGKEEEVIEFTIELPTGNQGSSKPKSNQSIQKLAEATLNTPRTGQTLELCKVEEKLKENEEVIEFTFQLPNRLSQGPSNPKEQLNNATKTSKLNESSRKLTERNSYVDNKARMSKKNNTKKDSLISELFDIESDQTDESEEILEFTFPLPGASQGSSQPQDLPEELDNAQVNLKTRKKRDKRKLKKNSIKISEPSKLESEKSSPKDKDNEITDLKVKMSGIGIEKSTTIIERSESQSAADIESGTQYSSKPTEEENIRSKLIKAMFKNQTDQSQFILSKETANSILDLPSVARILQAASMLVTEEIILALSEKQEIFPSVNLNPVLSGNQDANPSVNINPAHSNNQDAAPSENLNPALLDDREAYSPDIPNSDSMSSQETYSLDTPDAYFSDTQCSELSYTRDADPSANQGADPSGSQKTDPKDSMKNDPSDINIASTSTLREIVLSDCEKADPSSSQEASLSGLQEAGRKFDSEDSKRNDPSDISKASPSTLQEIVLSDYEKSEPLSSQEANLSGLQEAGHKFDSEDSMKNDPSDINIASSLTLQEIVLSDCEKADPSSSQEASLSGLQEAGRKFDSKDSKRNYPSDISKASPSTLQEIVLSDCEKADPLSGQEVSLSGGPEAETLYERILNTQNGTIRVNQFLPEVTITMIPPQRTIKQVFDENKSYALCALQLAEENKSLQLRTKEIAELMMQEMKCFKMGIKLFEGQVSKGFLK